MIDITNRMVDELFAALDEQLAAVEYDCELVIIGGLVAAAERVSRDYGMPGDWLHAGPTSLLDFGLPEGFLDRLETRRYGDALTVHFASRLDQIHFKLYALVDQGPGKHERDLRALEPNVEELIAAARWTRAHDPSKGFRGELERVLAHLGAQDVDLGA